MQPYILHDWVYFTVTWSYFVSSGDAEQRLDWKRIQEILEKLGLQGGPLGTVA